MLQRSQGSRWVGRVESVQLRVRPRVVRGVTKPEEGGFDENKEEHRQQRSCGSFPLSDMTKAYP